MKLKDFWDDKKNGWLEPWEVITKIRGGTKRHVQEAIKTEYQTLLSAIPNSWNNNILHNIQTDEEYDILNMQSFDLTVKDCKSKTTYWKLIDEKWHVENCRLVTNGLIS